MIADETVEVRVVEVVRVTTRLPAGHRVDYWTPDGEHLFTLEPPGVVRDASGRVIGHVVPLGRGEEGTGE